jgi:hypothetical protein
MKKAFLAIMFIAVGTFCFAMDEGQEPPLKFTMEINGQQHELVLDKAVTLAGDYKNPKVVLRASANRLFTYGDITFQYPSSFVWEAEIESKNERTWTLSGNDFKIMYFILPDTLSVEAYSQAMAKQFGKGSTRISDTERKLGGNRFKGKLLLVKLAGITLTMEVYSLPTKTGSRLLVFQDSPPDNRATSNEAEGALAMLSNSFRDTCNMPDAGVGK